eukprot:2401039-Rhodomonas_salina.2
MPVTGCQAPMHQTQDGAAQLRLLGPSCCLQSRSSAILSIAQQFDSKVDRIRMPCSTRDVLILPQTTTYGTAT